MMLTEQEAKQKRCCGPLNLALCVGSRCMAWRWYGPSAVEHHNTADEFIPPSDNSPPRLQPKRPPGDGWREVKDPKQWFGWTNWERPTFWKDARGWCGLAGNPKNESY